MNETAFGLKPDRFAALRRSTAYGALQPVADHVANGRRCPKPVVPAEWFARPLWASRQAPGGILAIAGKVLLDGSLGREAARERERVLEELTLREFDTGDEA